MKNQDLSITLTVDQTPQDVFDAINNVRGWWSETLKGETHELNDEFTYQYKDLHYSKQKLIEVTPDKKVVWLVTESDLSFLNNRSEWTGTKISFEISKKDGKTQMVFTHWGLTPEVECFDACTKGWSYYVENSLLPLITTGKGNPNIILDKPSAKIVA